MRRLKLLLLVVLLLVVGMLVGCQPTPGQFSTAEGQPCPAWAYDVSNKCDWWIWQGEVPMFSSSDYSELIDMGEYQKARLVVLGGEVLIDNPANVKFARENTEVVRPQTERLYPGVYIVERENKDQPASFSVHNPRTETVFFTIEFVRLAQPSAEQQR